MDIINRMKSLSEELLEHNYLYYVLDAPVISDVEYDRLFRRLMDLEGKYPHMITQTSCTFTKMCRNKAMYSVAVLKAGTGRYT